MLRAEVSLLQNRKTSDGRLRGAALVIVLTFLVVITGLVVAFLSSITNEATATTASAAAITSRGLADAAIQLTISQLRDATAGYDHNANDGTLNSNVPTGWASQPGLIRVFTPTNSSGSSYLYKLYSSTNMVDRSGTNSASNDLPSTGWWSNTALYVDLNAPVVRSNPGFIYTNYPIMDPALCMTNVFNGSSSTNYVDGFSINTNISALNGASNPAAMPVVWLYMLKNGTLVAPDPGSTTTATFNNAGTSNQPSASNPIVGRIAFWADDETCKLNINTASEGMPWDPPTFASLEENMYNDYPPTGLEFHRFSGHPFSVCLSPVLWSYFGFSHPAQLIWSSVSVFPPTGYSGSSIPVWLDFQPVASPIVTNGLTTSATNYVNALFGNPTNGFNGILPRVTTVTPSVTNSSLFGSYRTLNTNATRTGLNNSTSKADRLYASVDEMNFLATNSLGAPRTNNSTAFQPQAIARLRFFLTAESRAPEVNIFNLPRICLWPLNDTNNNNTANSYLSNLPATSRWSFLDKQIARCSTLGTNAFYFTRYDPTDPSNDFVNCPRNVSLYNYLVGLLKTPVPGYASSNGTANSFATRWGTGATYEMGTLCFDYIRSCINLVDSYGSNSTTADATNPPTRYAYSYTTPPTNFVTNITTLPNSGISLVDNDVSGTGQVIPISITTNGVTTRGMGRFPVIKSATIVFCAVAADQPPVMINTNLGATYRQPLTPLQINPLHPFVYSSANVLTNASQWEIITNTIISSTNTTYATNGVILSQTVTNIGYSNIIVPTNQFPSWYPSTTTNLNISTNATNTYSDAKDGSAYISYASSVNTNNPIGAKGYNYTNNMASNVMVLFNTNTGTWSTNGTNTYQRGNFTAFTNAHAMTLSHSGLLFGGDINTNTGCVDAYNAYFANIASKIPGFGTNSDTFTYPSYTYGSNILVPLSYTNGTSTATMTVGVPNTNSTLYPQPYQTVMQPVLIIDQGLPTPGFPPYNPNFKILVTGLGSLKADGANCWPSGNYGQTITNYNATAGYPGYGPDLGEGMAIWGNYSNNLTNGTVANVWPFVGNFVKATNNAATNYGRTFNFTSSGPVTVYYLKPSANLSNYASTPPAANDTNLLQTVILNFPSATFPTPKLPVISGRQSVSGYEFPPWYVQFGTYGGNTPLSDMSGNSNSPMHFVQPVYLLPSNSLGSNVNYGFGNNSQASMVFFMSPEQMSNSSALCYNTAPTLRSVEVTYGDWRIPMMMKTIAATNCATNGAPSGYGYTLPNLTNLYTPHLLYFAAGPETNLNTNFYWRAAHTLRGQRGSYTGDSGDSYVQNPGNFVQSFMSTGATNLNDPGVITANQPPFAPSTAPGRLLAHMLHYSHAGTMTNNDSGGWPEVLSTVDMAGYITNAVPSAMFSNLWTTSGGDFDNPIGLEKQDGPYFNKADEGSAGWNSTGTNNWGAGSPYSGSQPAWASVGRSRFSPNKQVPSAGILCSLPAGFDPSNPSITNAWRTLQFCPNPGSSNRATSNILPPDYLIMDLFDMPVVQPYPISDPFSTAGRVNLNYQIAPFTYIHRDSALRGVLKAIDFAAVPENQFTQYKNGYRQFNYEGTNGTTNYYAFRYPVHLNQTLQQFDYKFSTNGFFRVGAEICSMWLYPALAPNNASYPTNPATAVISDTPGSIINIFNWWYGNPGTTRKGLTGSNKRAEPYAAIYGNITTKSNTYQIHYRVQTLKQTSTAHGSSWSTWIDPVAGGITDKIIGEQRGSAVIERYIDPSDPRLLTNDFASLTNTNTMDAFYSYRVFNPKQFTP